MAVWTKFLSSASTAAAVAALASAAAPVVGLPGSVSFAQSAETALSPVSSEACERLVTRFGVACRMRNAPAPITDHDYGVVRLHFTPPPPGDVIPQRAMDGTWLESLAQRTVAQSVRSAVVLLEVRTVGPNLPANPDETGQATGVPIAYVPLAVYSYDSTRSLKFSEMQDFANRVIGPRLLIQRDQTIRVRPQIRFSQSDPSSLINMLAPVVRSAAAFGGHGFVVDAFASETLMADMSRIESTLRSVGSVDAESDNWIDLDFNDAGGQLVYDFQLNPRARFGRPAAPRPLGRVAVTLERRPSLFTDKVLAGGAPGARLPDYGVGGELNTNSTDLIWVDGRIRPGMSPADYMRQPLIGPTVTAFQSENITVPAFDTACRGLRAFIEAESERLSRHDRRAMMWAAFVTGPSSMRPELHDTQCIARDATLWRNYGLPLPATRPPPPPVPDAEARDEWIVNVATPILALDPTSPERFPKLRGLFGQQVAISAAPGTIFAAGEEPENGTRMDRDALARLLRPMPMQVGCRFIRQAEGADPNLPQFSFLARRGDTGQLLTFTADYAGRERGAYRVEIVGLRVEPTPSSDFEFMAQQSGIAQRCLDPATAPSGPPPEVSTSVVTPTP